MTNFTVQIWLSAIALAAFAHGFDTSMIPVQVVDVELDVRPTQSVPSTTSQVFSVMWKRLNPRQSMFLNAWTRGRVQNRPRRTMNDRRPSLLRQKVTATPTMIDLGEEQKQDRMLKLITGGIGKRYVISRY